MSIDGKIDINERREWKDSIEIYSVDITFNNEEDYGATISFGECIYEDHIMELDFEL